MIWTSTHMVSITLEGLWMVEDSRLMIFDLFVTFHRSGPAKFFRFWTITVHVSYPSKKVYNQAEIYQDFIKRVSITLEGLWMVSDRIVHFQFFVKFHRSGPAKIFSFWTITEHVSSQSKRFLIHPRLIRTSWRWWVLLWKDFGWFQIELSIFDFLSNFTGPDLQKFSVFELSRRRLVIYRKGFLIKPRLIWTSSR